jgi:signal transduction histidine kinase
LEAEGIIAALASQVRRLPIRVTVHAPGIARYPQAVETAVYFCVLEALQNVVKHAHASFAYVSLRNTGAGVTFEVSDDGIGFEPGSQQSGSGLANLADRVDALDGNLEVVTAPGRGTTIRGEIPVPTMEAAP